MKTNLVKFIEQINWPAMRQHKALLNEFVQSNQSREPLRGLLCFIDDLQNFAVDQGIAEFDTVFGLPEERMDAEDNLLVEMLAMDYPGATDYSMPANDDDAINIHVNDAIVTKISRREFWCKYERYLNELPGAVN